METEVAKIISTFPILLADRVTISIEKGEAVFYKGQTTLYAYFIEEGELIVQNPHQNGETYFISHMTKGSFMCDLEIISGNFINTTTVIAKTDCTLIRFPSRQFLAALKSNHDFLFMVSQKMAEKMYRESYRLGDDLYKSGVDKLRVYLVKSYREDNNGAQITINKTRQVISHEVGLSIKTVNRSVKKLKEQERLSILAGKIHITPKHYKLLVNDLAD
ncbi:Crp/Fnr family transcriptional regulator [Vibrio splendidus]|uniref:Crp/Fnr family transcriptional regulator n=1 Tax=Vibrio splendidus TaxID=29497 RepID=UPI000C83657F|nr:Crp/Fnr family transcriptional regulator [Vibrio splendidus]MBT9240040.1 Crp/Fnr family transcriptional regulator [Vibrio splendidus]MDH5903255.1 Crp/Fnr family transcriptional regulator [Vibrio splendidus]MDH5911234.1 Crp/Fnr family transcriptional regulator [Vibrio splendidus]MDH5942474.1 Crp/Fnr family transcriptional regulator [Vibrio splendidus]MDH5984381.1 Crp/Fnr family transcriptional regulator [Vibrio splendidus]